MAYLHISYSLPSDAAAAPLSAASSALFNSSQALLFVNPSGSKIPGKRSHHAPRVTCTGKNPKDNSEAGARVDRRNILFGLGGLYGAANIVHPPEAAATPVRPPDLSKCGTSTNWNIRKELDVKCCLNESNTIIDYKLPPVYRLRMREAAHRVSPEYIYKYNLATSRMKRLPADDPRNFMQQANVHCAYCNGTYDQPGQGTLDLQIHNSWLFFPWHRWYLYFYERILGKLIDDPSFALPFWNWDNPRGMTMPPMYVNPKSALYDDKRNQDHLPPAIIDLGQTKSNDPLQLVSNNLTILYSEMIRGNSTATDFMGQPYREGTTPDIGPGAIERGVHSGGHVWVGDPRQPSQEDMGNFYSVGRDPMFYAHHTNLDRLWMLWQYLPVAKVAEKSITDPDYLDASFVFYDENAKLVRVTVRDSIDNRLMGYDYDRIDLPWLDYRPPPQTREAKIKRIQTQVPKAESLFPLNLERVVRFEVTKTTKGKAKEVLLVEDIVLDTTKFLKFDVFINDEDDNPSELAKASYVGTYAQVPHKSRDGKTSQTTIRLKLTDLYEDMDVEDDDTLIVTLVPRHEGPGVTIGGIRIIEDTGN